MPNKYSSTAPLGIALVGVGTVGGGVLQLLHAHADMLRARCGRDIEVRAVNARNIAKLRARLPAAYSSVVVENWQAAATHPQVDVLVELMGGEDEAGECVKTALAAGKAVVTANKALLAAHGDEIFSAAQAAGKPVAFEAAVAGCIPIVKTLREALAADDVQEVAGIINGTCNYILTAMTDGEKFSSALAEAQKQGFAEADPSLDIDGVDAAHKIILIARLAFGAQASLGDILVSGVRGFDLRDVRYAAQFGFCVKLLAHTRRTNDGVELSVQPTLVPIRHPLASVHGAMNAILVRSAFAGETMYYGAGAGAQPTATAVLADIIDIARQNGALAVSNNGTSPPKLIASDDCGAPHFLRLRVIDRPGVLAEIAGALAAQNISIEAIHQNESAPGQQVDIILLLHETTRGRVLASAQEIEKQPAVVGGILIMPIKRFIG